MDTLEGHYHDMCDIEFTIEKGRLWILQTRIGKRTAFGEWVMAYDMLEEGLVDADTALLLGDYLYAHGLVRIAEAGGVDAVAVLAELISRCAARRADGAAGDGEEWVAAARALGGDPTDDEVALALARHSDRVAT
jgi:pyruvate,orthophosphate dikinase